MPPAHFFFWLTCDTTRVKSLAHWLTVGIYKGILFFRLCVRGTGWYHRKQKMMFICIVGLVVGEENQLSRNSLSKLHGLPDESHVWVLVCYVVRPLLWLNHEHSHEDHPLHGEINIRGLQLLANISRHTAIAVRNYCGKLVVQSVKNQNPAGNVRYIWNKATISFQNFTFFWYRQSFSLWNIYHHFVPPQTLREAVYLPRISWNFVSRIKRLC